MIFAKTLAGSDSHNAFDVGRELSKYVSEISRVVLLLISEVVLVSGEVDLSFSYDRFCQGFTIGAWTI